MQRPMHGRDFPLTCNLGNEQILESGNKTEGLDCFNGIQSRIAPVLANHDPDDSWWDSPKFDGWWDSPEFDNWLFQETGIFSPNGKQEHSKTVAVEHDHDVSFPMDLPDTSRLHQKRFEPPQPQAESTFDWNNITKDADRW
jgi:hypothetical protein